MTSICIAVYVRACKALKALLCLSRVRAYLHLTRCVRVLRDAAASRRSHKVVVRGAREGALVSARAYRSSFGLSRYFVTKSVAISGAAKPGKLGRAQRENQTVIILA